MDASGNGRAEAAHGGDFSSHCDSICRQRQECALEATTPQTSCDSVASERTRVGTTALTHVAATRNHRLPGCRTRQDPDCCCKAAPAALSRGYNRNASRCEGTACTIATCTAAGRGGANPVGLPRVSCTGAAAEASSSSRSAASYNPPTLEPPQVSPAASCRAVAASGRPRPRGTITAAAFQTSRDGAAGRGAWHGCATEPKTPRACCDIHPDDGARHSRSRAAARQPYGLDSAATSMAYAQASQLGQYLPQRGDHNRDSLARQGGAADATANIVGNPLDPGVCSGPPRESTALACLLGRNRNSGSFTKQGATHGASERPSSGDSDAGG